MTLMVSLWLILASQNYLLSNRLWRIVNRTLHCSLAPPTTELQRFKKLPAALQGKVEFNFMQMRETESRKPITLVLMPAETEAHSCLLHSYYSTPREEWRSWGHKPPEMTLFIIRIWSKPVEAFSAYVPSEKLSLDWTGICCVYPLCS